MSDEITYHEYLIGIGLWSPDDRRNPAADEAAADDLQSRCRDMFPSFAIRHEQIPGVDSEHHAWIESDGRLVGQPIVATSRALAICEAVLQVYQVSEGAAENRNTRGDLEKELSDVGEKKAEQLLQKNALVLVVDDSVDGAAMISLDLQHEGYRVITASNGEEAARVALFARPDIILMDIAMPELDGYGAIAKIRGDEKLRPVPVIAITAFSTAGFRRAAFNAGFDGYLTKPVEFQMLHELMSKLLTEGRAA
jgi:two-component system cell cycle response regulator DivK